MKKIAAGKFKAQCLSIIDNVYKRRECVLITKRGRPVARLLPLEQKSDDFIGRLEGVIQIVGDIETPLVPPEDWEALR